MISLSECSKRTNIHREKLKRILAEYYSHYYLINENGLYYIDEEIVDKISEDFEGKNNRITMKEASRRIGISHTTVKKLIDSEINNYKTIEDTIYIDEKDIEKILKFYEEHMTTEQISEVYNICKLKIQHIVGRWNLDGVKWFNSKRYVPKSEVDRIISILNIKDESYTLSQVSNILGITGQTIRNSYIDTVFKKCVKINGQIYYNKQEVDEYVKNLSKNIQFKNEKYLGLEETQEILGLGYNTVRTLMKKGPFKNEYIIDKPSKKILIKKDVVFKEKDFLDRHIIVSELSEQLGVCGTSIRKYLISGKIKKFVKYYDNIYRIDKDEIENIKKLYDNNLEEKATSKMTDKERISYLLDKNFKTELTETLQLSKEFAYYKIKKSRSQNKNKSINPTINALTAMSYLLPKEITQISEYEKNNLIKNESLNKTQRQIIGNFISYLLINYKEKCNFIEKVIVYSESKKYRAKDEIYTIEQWSGFYQYLTNIDMHFGNAVNNKVYANVWMFTLLHLTLAWRKSDMIKVPRLDLKIVDIYDFKWFEDNIFTFGMGENVILYLEEMLRGAVANKNQQELRLVIATQLILPISIAYVLCEIHNNDQNQKTLFESKYTFDDKSIKRFFSKSKLVKFSSLKANRSLLTYQFEQALNSGGSAYMAYTLSSVLRSHTMKLNGISDTTHQYIYSIRDDGAINDITFGLFCRGHFGYLYKAVVDIAYGDGLAFNNVTQIIQDIKRNVDPMELEGIAEVIRLKTQDVLDVIDGLVKMDKEHIQITVQKLLKGELPSKNQYIQCIKRKKCEHPLLDECLTCKYALLTRYSIYTIVNKVEYYIDKLKELSEEDIVYRKKFSYILGRLLLILQEIKTEFKKYDSNFLDTIIDLKILHSQIQELYLEKKFLLLN